MAIFYLEMRFYPHIYITWILHTDTYEHDKTYFSYLTNTIYFTCFTLIMKPYVSLCSEITS